MFFIVSGSATLRTLQGTDVVHPGDMIFFEKGENGAHQLYNHTEEACIYLDIRTYLGYDIAEYPDSGKILIAPSFEIFRKESQTSYFEGERNVKDHWKNIKSKRE